MYFCTIPVYPAGAGYGAGHFMFSAAEAWGDTGLCGQRSGLQVSNQVGNQETTVSGSEVSKGGRHSGHQAAT